MDKREELRVSCFARWPSYCLACRDPFIPGITHYTCRQFIHYRTSALQFLRFAVSVIRLENDGSQRYPREIFLTCMHRNSMVVQHSSTHGKLTIDAKTRKVTVLCYMLLQLQRWVLFSVFTGKLINILKLNTQMSCNISKFNHNILLIWQHF